jgi:predicted Zn-dependent peptidase
LLGARAKAWTTIDRTVFEVSVRPEQLKEVVKLLAEHILKPSWTVARLEEAKAQLLSKHLDARRWSGRRMLTRLLQQTYHGHPNGRLTLPNPEQIQSLSLEHVQALYQRFYQPTRAHLVSVGSVDEEQLREWVDEAWSEWGSRASSTDAGFPSYPIAKLRGPDVELEVMGNGYAQLFISFPVPHLTPEGIAYLDLVSLLLVGDTDGRLYQVARRAGIDLKSARVFPISPDGPGAFVMSFEVSPKQVDALWRVTLEQLYQLSNRPPPLRLLEQAKLLFERETVRVNGSLSSQARRLGFFSSRWPNANALARYGRALAQTRPLDLTAYLKDLISSKRLHALVRSPAPEGVDPGLWVERFREQAFTILDQRDLDFRPGFHVINDQLGLLYEPSDSDGAVHVELTLPIADQLSKVHELSLGHWLAAQMSERLPHEPHYEASFHDRSITVGATIANSQLDEALSGLLARVRRAPLVTEHGWSSDTLERARQRALSGLEMSRQQPWHTLRYLERRASTAGKRGPLPSPSERIDRLKKQGSASLVRWYQEHVQGRPALLVVSGDVGHVELSRALQLFRVSSGGDAVEVKALKSHAEQPALRRCRQVLMSNDHKRVWASISFGLDQLKPELLPALAVLEASLSYPQAKLSRELNTRREVRRLQVSGHKVLQTPRLSLWLEVSPEGYQPAVNYIRESLDSLSSAPLEMELFQDIKRYALAQQAHQLSALSARARWLSQVWFRGWRGAEAQEGGSAQWWGAIDLVTPAQLQEAARALSFERATEAVWGPPNAQFALEGCKKINL